MKLLISIVLLCLLQVTPVNSMEIEQYEGCDCQENFRKYRDKAISINGEMFVTKHKIFYINPYTIVLGNSKKIDISNRDSVVYISNEDNSTLGIIIQ